jgi:hypothetical protein
VTRIVMVLFALCACGQTMWLETRATKVVRDQRIFVVTNGRAVVFDVTENDGTTLRGRPTSAWTFEPTLFRVRAKDTPKATAQRLGWTPMAAAQAPREIAWRDVLYASSDESSSGADAGGEFVIFIVLIGGVVGLFVLAALRGAAHAR